MTRFPKIRRLMRLRAVLMPALFFAGFLCFAKGMLVVAIMVAGLALGAFLVLPGGMQKPVLLLQLPERQGLEKWRFWLGQAVWSLVWFWLISQPEAEAFLQRVNHGGALWDGRLILLFGILTILGIIPGWQRASTLSDQQIYDWLAERQGE